MASLMIPRKEIHMN